MPARFLVTAGSGDSALALRSDDLHSIGEPYIESCRSGSHRPLATRSKSAQMTAVEVADRSVALSSRILPTFFIRRRSAWRAAVRARPRDAARRTLELLGVGRTPHAACRAKPAPALGRNPAQTLVQGHVVPSTGRCPHGGRARSLCRTARSP